MSPDWLWVGLIGGAAGGFTLLFILGAFKLSQRADRQADRIMRDLADESERVVRHGDQHPAHPWADR